MNILEKIDQLDQKIKDLRFSDNQWFYWLHGRNGIEVFPNFSITSYGGNSSSSYSGPFAVTKKDDTTVTILGYHADENRNWRNYVYAGLTATEVAEQDKGSITTSGYLYLDVTYSSGYSVAVGYAASVPSQSSTHYYHPLAWIECSDNKISSILQMQYGQVHVAGRVV